MAMGKSDIYNSIDKKKDTSKGAHQINQLDYITKERKMLYTHEIIKAVEAEFDRIDIPEKNFTQTMRHGRYYLKKSRNLVQNRD